MDRSLAVIPARGGSKRIPRKNIRPFHGKPMIAYSIETALESGIFERVIVSTDDKEIAETARKYGAEVPFIRPADLADDFTGTDAVTEHALKWFASRGESYDFVCTVYATAPLLTAESLIEGYQRLKDSNAVYAFSATSMPFPIQRTFKITPEGRCEMFLPEHYTTRSQDLEEAYQDAGQFYWRALHRGSSEPIFGRDSIPILLPRYRVQDIDTLEDWERAEKMYEVLNPDTYDRWNQVKKTLKDNHPIHFRPREIYFMSIGHNVGWEVYGKGGKFLRPVLVFRKLSRYAFIGIPLTSQGKNGSYFFPFSYKKGRQSVAMLHQMRMFDIRRAAYKSGVMSSSDFQQLKGKMGEFMEITP